MNFTLSDEQERRLNAIATLEGRQLSEVMEDVEVVAKRAVDDFIGSYAIMRNGTGASRRRYSRYRTVSQAEHDDWQARYRAGEKISSIAAGTPFHYTTVFHHVKNRTRVHPRERRG